jgi:hypothetical protein
MWLKLSYSFRAIINIVITIICYCFLNWIVVLFCDEKGNLPRSLSWFQTFDATCDEGMFARRNELASGTGTDEWDGFVAYPETKFHTYMNRVKWLLRNSSYGFDYFLMGIPFNPDNWRIVKYIDTPELIVFIAVGNGFNYYYHGKWGNYKFGWKAWNYWRGSYFSKEPWGPEMRLPLVTSFNPFKRRKP